VDPEPRPETPAPALIRHHSPPKLKPALVVVRCPRSINEGEKIRVDTANAHDLSRVHKGKIITCAPLHYQGCVAGVASVVCSREAGARGLRGWGFAQHRRVAKSCPWFSGKRRKVGRTSCRARTRLSRQAVSTPFTSATWMKPPENLESSQIEEPVARMTHPLIIVTV